MYCSPVLTPLSQAHDAGRLSHMTHRLDKPQLSVSIDYVQHSDYTHNVGKEVVDPWVQVLTPIVALLPSGVGREGR